MPICKYFTSPSGCARGDNCYYQHVQKTNYLDTDPVGCLAKRVQRSQLADRNAPEVAAISTIPAPRPAKQSYCRFFALGCCKNGEECRFRHDKVSEEDKSHEAVALPDPSTLPVTKPKKAIDANTRHLGGALVKFGDGAKVISIEPAMAETARLQMCNVTCSWYQPSKIATLEFTSTQSMNEAAEHLKRTKILSRSIECRTSVNKRTKPWQCLVKVGNLDVTTSLGALKEACGKKYPHTIKFSEPNYSSSSEEIGQAVHKLLSSKATVEAFSLSQNQSGQQAKATATLQSVEQAEQLIRDFDGYKLPRLAGSNIRLSHMIKAKMTTLTAIYEMVTDEIIKARSDLRPKTFLEIKTYASTGPFTTVHIISSSPKEVARAKAAIDQVLKGHTARSGKDYVWHKFFLQPDGVQYLNALGKEHGVYIYRNAKRCVLSLYGRAETRAVVESLLIKAVEDMASSSHTLTIDEGITSSILQRAYRRIVAEFGKSAVRLNATSSLRTISVEGSSQDADRTRNILLDISARTEDPHNTNDHSNTCTVCWCEVSDETYITPCRHLYDRTCFAAQCASAGATDFPLLCLGSEGQCNKVITFAELELALTRDELDTLLSKSFTGYVAINPAQYQYCPTPSCETVYTVTADSKIFTCPSCLTQLCTTCGSTSHEGLTCEENKVVDRSDKAFEQWKKESGAKDCPKCGSVIEKHGGCNHMQCQACKAHLCWVCMKMFESANEAYGHLAKEHGGIFETGLWGTEA